MRMRTVRCERFDVVLVAHFIPQRDHYVRRPALILSTYADYQRLTGQVLLAMITSAAQAPCPLDCPISDLAVTGLPCPSVVRAKLLTLDARRILRSLGHLGTVDQLAVQHRLWSLLGESFAEVDTRNTPNNVSENQLDLLATPPISEPTPVAPEPVECSTPIGNEQAYLSTQSLMALLRRGR